MPVTRISMKHKEGQNVSIAAASYAKKISKVEAYHNPFFLLSSVVMFIIILGPDCLL